MGFNPKNNDNGKCKKFYYRPSVKIGDFFCSMEIIL